jgi:cytochrome c553
MIREGTRKIPAMEPFVQGLSEDDLGRFADSISKLPQLTPPGRPINADRYEHGKTIATAGRCATCHNTDFSGAGTNPRLAHQREDYLVKALRDFKSAARVDQGAIMAASVKDLGDAELVALAHYLANLR